MKTSEKLRFSIVIPCYNEANFIRETLISLKAQDTTEKYEIIVVDNNCNDETVKIARDYGATIVTEKQAGVCFARQAGTESAKGEIIVSTDADTVFSPGWLSFIDNCFNKSEKIVAIGGPCRYYNGPWWGKFYTYFLFSTVYLYYLATGHPFYITATNIAFKKSVWQGYDTRLMQGGDELDLLHELRRRGKVRFSNSNPTYTSGRRLSNGLAYNFFITFLFYYLGAYYINKAFKRTVIGSAPAFRKINSSRALQRAGFGLVPLVFTILVIVFAVTPLRLFLSHNVHSLFILIADKLRAMV